MINYGVIATVTERSEEMPVVQSVVFDSLRDAPPPPVILLRKTTSTQAIIVYFPSENPKLLRNLGGGGEPPPYSGELQTVRQIKI